MEVIKILGKASPSGADVNIYTVPTDKGAVISSLNICNRDTYDATIKIAIKDTAFDPVDEDYLEYNMTVYGNCSAQRLKGVTLAQGDIVVVSSSSENVSFQLFGSEFDQSFEYP
jgi:hypothetical protein